MWKVKDNVDGKTKLENAKIIKEEIEGLKKDIKEIISLEIGINIVEGGQAYDIVLDSQFASIEDLSIYQKHPNHLEVVKSLGKLLESRVVIDYEMDTII